MSASNITTDTIAATEQILGIAYTPAERALMLDNLDGQIEAAQARRKIVFPNDLQPASRFDPRLPGTPPPPPQQPLVRSSRARTTASSGCNSSLLTGITRTPKTAMFSATTIQFGSRSIPPPAANARSGVASNSSTRVA